jgi:dTDP-4-dehydrorhamnose reductase
MLTENKKYCNPEIWGGVECTINRVGDEYFDQLYYANYYQNILTATLTDLGIKKIRFPILWEKHQPFANTVIDWTWAANQIKLFQKKNIDVIAGLVHHGSGPLFTNLLDEKFPYLLAEYAKKVAEQFPWIKYYTPINEPLTTARFSGLYALWYPHLKTDRSFLLMLLHQLKGVVLSMQEIRKINPQAKLIQTEDLGKTYSTPLLAYQARFENERRWLSFDLLCGKVNEKHKLWKYFKRFDIPEHYLNFFRNNPCTPDIFGFNHYATSERYLDENINSYPKHTHGGNKRHRYADVEVVRVETEEKTGIGVLLNEAWKRYQQPIAVTEVHLHCHREEQLRWFKYIWNACLKAKEKGINIKAITSWAVFGSFGWNKLLTQPYGEYEPGAFDIRSGLPRPTALATLIKNITSKGQMHHHHLAIEKGWWQRESRLVYQPPLFSLSKKEPDTKSNPLLIIGKKGTLGKAFAKTCFNRAIKYKLLSRQDCDIGELETIETAIRLYKPFAIINAAGYVRVDDAENEAELCFRENSIGACNLAAACKKYGIKLVSFSTDLVFDGSKNTPYVETDKVNPLNIYGRSKAESETKLQLTDPSSLIIRTSAFFSPSDNYNFLHWVAESLNSNLEIPVANDVHISPTYVPDLANAALDLLIDDEKGIWHLSNKGVITWADLAYVVAKKIKHSGVKIKAVPSSHLNWLAKRPKYSVLGTEKGYLLPDLDNALDRYFIEKQHYAELII